MNISIFGLGYVGCVSLGCLAQNGHNLIGVDLNSLKIKQINNGQPTIIEKDIDNIIRKQRENKSIKATQDYKKAILETELSIISVGTPSTPKGHLNLNYIYNVAEQFAESLEGKDEFHTIAIRSTVLPGTCDKFAEIIEKNSNKLRNIDFAIVDNPEFLREGSAVYDYYNPPLTLVGSDNKEAANTVGSLYEDLPAEIIITELKVAEIMKYVNNTFHALKISFANEVGNICHELGIDSHEVMNIFTKDKQLNISPYYFKPGFAYGGSCLPKDLKGFQTLAHDHYVKAPVVENIDKTNDLQIQRAINIIEHKTPKKIGFLGLSFKPGTDDLRNSPAVSVIESLLGKGYNMEIYDKNVHLSKLTGTNKEYIEQKIPHLSRLIVNNLEELIDNCDLLVINNKEEEFRNYINKIHDKAIIDMVRLDESLINNDNYIGINW